MIAVRHRGIYRHNRLLPEVDDHTTFWIEALGDPEPGDLDDAVDAAHDLWYGAVGYPDVVVNLAVHPDLLAAVGPDGVADATRGDPWLHPVEVPTASPVVYRLDATIPTIIAAARR